MEPNQPRPRRRALRILLWVGGILLAVLLVGLFAVDRWIRSQYEPQLAELRTAITDNVDFFCEQQARLAADPWFHESRTQGDAGPLLNAWLPWEPGGQMPADSPLALPAQLPRKGLEPKEWLTSEVDVSTLDFRWMERLHAYDHWDLMKNAPVEPQAPYNWATAPLPRYVTLRTWANYRLMHGLKTGQPLAAARDVRQLAWLLYRTESMIGAFFAAHLLQLEREAYEQVQAPPPEWRPMSRAQVEELRALLMSAPLFSHLVAPVELAKKAQRCAEPVMGCIALTEAAFFAKIYEPVARDGYGEEYAAFQEELKTRPCATSAAKTIWELGLTVKDQEAVGGTPEQLEWARSLPAGYVGSHIAGMGLAAGVPDFLKSLEGLRQLRTASASKQTP